MFSTKMSAEHKYIKYFLFRILTGIFIGSILALWWEFKPSKPEEIQRQKRHISLNDSQNDIQVPHNVRVLCWVMTNPTNHKTKAIHIKYTWGPRCDKLLFMSSGNDSLLNTIPLPVKEGREYLWDKTKLAFKYIYENHFNDAEWFLKVDDDTYIVMENLKKMLHPHKPETPIYFGGRYKPFSKQGFMAGGSGYVLSKQALKLFIEKGLSNPKACRLEEGFPEDGAIGICLSNVGVVAGDSRDEKKRLTFFPIGLIPHIFPEKKDKSYWYWRYQFYNTKIGFECCSDYPISFHYIEPTEMHIYEYLINHVHPYGISHIVQPLSNNKISTELDVIKAKLDTNEIIPKIRIKKFKRKPTIKKRFG